MSKTNPIAIDHADVADIPALVALLATLFTVESDFSADSERQRHALEMLLRLPESRAVVYVARTANGRAVGMASAQLVISTAEGAASAWVEDVVVSAGYRGKGVARRLLTAVLDWAALHGATRAQLLADRGNESALGFYRHLGWQPTRLATWRVFLGRRP